MSAPSGTFHTCFLPEGRTAEASDGATLLEVARAANVYVGSVCGGDGVCGKCRVIIREGDVVKRSTGALTRDELRRGYVLACQTVPRSNLVVEVPPESRLGGSEDLLGPASLVQEGDGTGNLPAHVLGPLTDEPPVPPVPHVKLDPLVEKFALALPEPTVDDPRGDRERLLEMLSKRRSGPVQMDVKVMRELPHVLRSRTMGRTSWNWKWDGRITATVGVRGDLSEVLCVEHGDTTNRPIFGLAVDVGTTTVVGQLVDLRTGEDAAPPRAKYNSQIKYGADVISRINYARQSGGAETLHQAVIHDIETLIGELVGRARLSREDIACVVAAGNTAMSHFLLALEADLIRISPFAPAATCPPPVLAAEIGLRINPRASVYTLPMAGSYVGGDITAGILASRMHDSDEISLLLDIGTNGEVVLGNRDFLAACSASAGPAFEGGAISCGMRATSGAIDRVRILPEPLEISVMTIDEQPPLGLCGTGLIDSIAEMLLAGIVDRGGHFQVDRAPGRFRSACENGGPQFVLVAAENSGSGSDIVLTEADVENLIRTKGSIYAAAESLVHGVGLTSGDIQNVYIAGAFGNRLDVAHCIAIGLLPDVPLERIHFIGNGSLAGAKAVMLSRPALDEIYRIRDRITYRELMVDPTYMEQFTSARFLPHTDLSRFPSVFQPQASGRAAASSREGESP